MVRPTRTSAEICRSIRARRIIRGVYTPSISIRHGISWHISWTRFVPGESYQPASDAEIPRKSRRGCDYAATRVGADKGFLGGLSSIPHGVIFKCARYPGDIVLTISMHNIYCLPTGNCGRNSHIVSGDVTEGSNCESLLTDIYLQRIKNCYMKQKRKITQSALELYPHKN